MQPNDTTDQAAGTAITKAQTHSSRTVPIVGTLQTVPGYPEKLKIYRIAASSFWQVRYYDEIAAKTIKRSTGQLQKAPALKEAKALYERILINRHNGVATRKNSRFDVCAKGMMEMQAARVARKEISEAAHQNDQYFLDGTILPEFREIDIAEITYDTLERFIGKIGARLSASSTQRYLGLIRKVLEYAANRQLLQAVPKFPKVQKQDSPRGWFRPDEYAALVTRAKQLVGTEVVLRNAAKPGQKQGNVVRRLQITNDLPNMIEFVAHSFIRPTDLKNMQHKHVEVIRKNHTFLRLTLPESKKHDKPIATLEKAVGIYEKMKAATSKKEGAISEDYVFMPEYANRDTALRRLQQQFNYLLEDLGYKKGALGEERTIYSLRHTCIMFRLLDGDNIDLLTLARNARTSVDMIERFYASQLTGEMNIDSLQSVRKSKGLQLTSPTQQDIPLKIQSGILTLDNATNTPATASS